MARKLGECVGSFMRHLSRYIDMPIIDGVTLGDDYPKALAELDRGHDSAIVLPPLNDMTSLSGLP